MIVWGHCRLTGTGTVYLFFRNFLTLFVVLGKNKKRGTICFPPAHTSPGTVHRSLYRGATWRPAPLVTSIPTPLGTTHMVRP